MASTICVKTGNPIVDEIATLNIVGNVVPEAWYHTIVSEKGKVNSLALLILADIVYWYRPSENRDEATLSVTYTKRFRDDDFLQRSYDQLCQKFNITKRQARDVIVFLEELGVIKRHLRIVETANGPVSNVLFLELIPSVLKRLTYPTEDRGVYKNVDSPLQICRDLPPKEDIPLSKNEETYTKTTTKNNTEITTTTVDSSVVAVVKEIFHGLSLSDKDIASILMASNNDIEKCKTARTILDQQTTNIGNVAGWLIKAIKDNYMPVAKKASKKKNSFTNYPQREYDYDELERLLLNTSPAS